LSQQLHEHRAGQLVAIGTGRQTIHAAGGRRGEHGGGLVRVGSGPDWRTRAKVFHDVAQTLLDMRALVVIQDFKTVIDLDRSDDGDEHRIVKRG
jgi:hypothetical protein